MSTSRSGYCCRFFNCVASILPTPADAFSAVSATATTMILGPAIADLGIFSKDFEHTASHIFAALIATQTDLMFARPELAKNASRLASWLCGNGRPEAKSEESVGYIDSIVNYVGTPIVAASFVTVPAAVIALAKFQVKQILTDKQLMKLLFDTELDEKDATVIALSWVSALFAVYYSIGTEGASAFKWFAEKNPDSCNFIKNQGAVCCCPCCSAFPSPLAWAGAIEHSMRETGSLLSVLVESGKLTNRVLAFAIAAASMIIMTLQNTTFQGREFKEHFEELFHYIYQNINTVTTEMRDPTSTPIPYHALEGGTLQRKDSRETDIKLNACQKTALFLSNLLVVVTPSVIAHFSLAYSSLRQKDNPLRAFIAGINTMKETFTETISACDEFSEKLEPCVSRCCR